MPFEANEVQSTEFEWDAATDCVWRDVVRHAAHAADHGVVADPDELMDAGEAADNRAVFDQDMTGQGCAVAHDDPIAHGAVVGDMAVGHDEAAVADGNHAIFLA